MIKVMPFGKHKGERIKRLPLDYLTWLSKQYFHDPHLRLAVLSAYDSATIRDVKALEEADDWNERQAQLYKDKLYNDKRSD